MGLFFFEIEQQERLRGATEGEFGYSAVRRSFIKLFFRSAISQERKTVSGRKEIV